MALPTKRASMLDLGVLGDVRAHIFSGQKETMQTGDQIPGTFPERHELRGYSPLFEDDLRVKLEDGARCVRFEYCISFLFWTLRRQSPVYLTHSWQERYLWGLWYSLLALLLGPWGVPWGLLCTPWAIWVNTSGGADCSQEIFPDLKSPRAGP